MLNRHAEIYRPEGARSCVEFQLAGGYVSGVVNHGQAQLYSDTIIMNDSGPGVFGINGSNVWAALICENAPSGLYEAGFIALDGRGNRKQLETLTIEIKEDRVPGGQINWFLEPKQDSDDDSVYDNADLCQDTAPDSIVNGNGCALSQICPCDAFKNHGQYQSCTTRTIEEFIEASILTETEGEVITSHSAKSTCGKKRKK